MDAFFRELGRTVLERWKRENFSLAKFPEIARAALDEHPPVEHVDLPTFVREFLLNDEQAFRHSRASVSLSSSCTITRGSTSNSCSGWMERRTSTSTSFPARSM